MGQTPSFPEIRSRRHHHPADGRNDRQYENRLLKPSKMKLAYLVSQYPAANHAFMFREVKRLRELGFEISMASIAGPDRPPEKLTEEERLERATTFYVKNASIAEAAKAHCAVLVSHPFRYARTLFYALKLGDWHPRKTLSGFFYFVEAVIAGRWILHQGATHVHVHYSSTIGLLATRLFPITMSVTFHGPDEFNDTAGFRVAEKIKASRFVCAISNYARSQLMKTCDYAEWSKLEVTPLGVDVSVFAPRPFLANPPVFRIVCAGRLAPVKGQHILIAALEILIRRGRNIVVHLAGGGPDRQSLEKTVAERDLHDRVVFEGLLNQDQLRRLYQESDAMVLASFAEGVPVVLMEAMAMEIPCVTTWITGIPELIENRKDGLLVPPGDAPALAEAIEMLISNGDLRLRLGRAGREKVLRQYDIRRNGARLAEVFEQRLKAT
jgi:colanic acid/amylovoran biosynthesis glycosyltransferase